MGKRAGSKRAVKRHATQSRRSAAAQEKVIETRVRREGKSMCAPHYAR